MKKRMEAEIVVINGSAHISLVEQLQPFFADGLPVIRKLSEFREIAEAEIRPRRHMREKVNKDIKRCKKRGMVRDLADKAVPHPSPQVDVKRRRNKHREYNVLRVNKREAFHGTAAELSSGWMTVLSAKASRAFAIKL